MRRDARRTDTVKLTHELEVHRAELESQNDELRGARQEREAALARYTELFDFAPIGYITLDGDDTIRQVNHAGARALSVSGSRLIGKRFATLVSPADFAAFNDTIRCVRESEESATCEVSMSTGQGKEDVVMRITVSPRPRDPRGLLLGLEDVTRNKIARELLAESERALRDSNRRKDEFLAMLSHELRNPLAPIRTSLFVLANSESGSPAVVEAREIIDRQVVHLTRIVDDLLDMTRITRGKIRLQRARVELGALVQRTVEDHRPGFEASELALVVSRPPEPLWVDVDAERIVQALSNVITNALKFTPPGGRVDVSLRARASLAELQVRDTGVGIATNLMRYLFEPFAQGPQAADRKTGGRGLGLAMVKGFVELHGGEVGISSGGPGQGTAVTLTLPLSRPGAVAAPAALPRLTSRRVLVVEDQPDAACALQQALSLLGLEVRVTANGGDALDLARVFHPEIVLCDIGLPGMDGYDVARAFRGDQALRDAYLVALSGYAQPEDVDRAIEAGFRRHLAKPASLDTLVRVIAEAG